MRTNYFLKVLAVFGFILFTMNLSAKVITVKDQGTDSDIADALSKAVTGDTILIQGQILFSAPVPVSVNVEFLGEGDNAYFDGQGKTQLFNINPDLIEGAGLTFENLGFYEAYNNAGGSGQGGSDGGAAQITGGNVEFINCWFDENQSMNRGGAFFINNGATVRFAGCEASGNIGYSSGGFLYGQSANTSVSFQYCTIGPNNNAQQSRGGAFFLDGGTYSYFYTKISGNTDGVEDGSGNKVSGEGGGAITTTTATVTMESCAITSNTTYGDHGSTFFLMGDPNITLINTLIAGNYTRRGAGSWFIANDAPGIDITLVNTTMVANKSDDNAGNAGAGIRVMNPNNRINVFNSIIAQNICHASDPSNPEYGAIDMGYSGTTADAITTLVTKNSIIGLIGYVDPSNVPASIDNPNIPQKSLINMYYNPTGNTQPNYSDMDVSGVDYIDQPLVTTSFKMPYYTLTDNTVIGAKLGDPALLSDQDTNTDQLLVKRTTASDGSVFAGAVQGVAGGTDYDDSGWDNTDNVAPAFYPFNGTGIQSIAVAKQGISIIGVTSNGILGVDFGDLKGHATGVLVNVAGQEVEKVFDLNVVSKGYYNIYVAPGMYILKVDIAGKTYAQKLIVTK